MKKTLLLATALACSGAAQAEIFSCTSTYGAAIDRDELVKAPIATQSWIVDTTRGLRVTQENRVVKDYAGDCEVLGRNVGLLAVCNAEDGIFTHTVKIQKRSNGEINFLASMLGVYSISHAGTCTEI